MWVGGYRRLRGGRWKGWCLHVCVCSLFSKYIKIRSHDIVVVVVAVVKLLRAEVGPQRTQEERDCLGYNML